MEENYLCIDRNSTFLNQLVKYFPLNPKGGGGGGGPKVPTGQEIVCHFSQGHAMVTKNLDFVHKHAN